MCPGRAVADAGRVTDPRARSTARPTRTALFVVELRAALGVPTDLGRMHQDLASAVDRLRERGVDVHLTDTLLLPDDARCLCLLHGPDSSTVALACDTAGLTGAPVHTALHLPPHPRGVPEEGTVRAI